MTNATPQRITWGDLTNSKYVEMWGQRVPVAPHDQGVPRLSTGADIERAAQQGLTKLKFSTHDGGLSHRTGIQPWGSALSEYTMNQGIQTRLSGLAILPYRLTTQTLTGDISSAVAGNIRAHVFNTALGASGLRWGVAVGNHIYLDTSTTNPELAELSSTAFTNICTAIEEQMVANNTRYAAFAYNGTTQDIRGFSSVSGLAYNSGWTTLVNLSNDDWVNAMRYIPTLGPGCAVYVGRLAGNDGVFYTLGTDSLPMSLKTVVLAATKDQIGNLSSQSSGSLSMGLADEAASPLSRWGTNVNSSSPTTLEYGYKWAYLTSLPSIPAIAYIVGLQIAIAYSENGSGDASLAHDGARISTGGGLGPAFGSGNRTSSGTENIGSSSNPLGTAMRGSDARSFSLRIGGATVNHTSGAAVNWNITSASVTMHYRMPGQTLAFPTGGWQTSPSPAFPHRICMIAPESSDTSGIITPRKAWFLDFEWDPSGERPVFTPSTPETNMRYIHAGCPYQGGYVFTGGDVAGPGRFVRHVDGSGQVRNFRLPRWNGKEWLCNSLLARGSWLVADMVATDYSDRQWWLFNNGKWFPDTLWQSLSDTAIAAQPIPFAESALGLQQQQAYSIFPASTSTAAVRQFLPEDLDADPRLFNTSEVKSMAYTANTTEDTPLLLRGLEMDFGPEEANKALVAADFQGRLVSDDETVRSRIDITGDQSFATPAVTKEFESAFEHYDVPGYGVSYQTMIHELGLMHEPGTAKTPNGAGILYTSVQQWPTLNRIDIELDENRVLPRIHQFMDEIRELAVEKAPQPLRIGDKVYNTVFEGLVYGMKAPAYGQSVPNANVVNLIARFREVPGSE